MDAINAFMQPGIPFRLGADSLGSQALRICQMSGLRYALDLEKVNQSTLVLLTQTQAVELMLCLTFLALHPDSCLLK